MHDPQIPKPDPPDRKARPRLHVDLSLPYYYCCYHGRCNWCYMSVFHINTILQICIVRFRQEFDLLDDLTQLPQRDLVVSRNFINLISLEEVVAFLARVEARCVGVG